MCGIAGKFTFKPQSRISLDLIKRMISVIRHRGPDESGIYLDDYIGLGHARLSIIDLAGGTQPIHNEDKSLWIVYNGEVFNYPEIKQDLIKKGHHFYTTTDTEVVLHLFEEKGPAFLEELNGQFAIAIWDSKRRVLFLARDRVGIRPLYYTVRNNALLFASEIKAVFMDESIRREINPVVLNQIFTFWTSLPGETIFKDIHELPPGQYMIATENQITIKKYWDIPFCPPDEQLDWPVDKICDQIQELLIDATRIRLRADVPVGCYLSGGLDSSGVTTLVVKNFNNQARTFGIQFEEQAFDESDYQNQMVSFLGTQHSELLAKNEKIGKALPDVLWHCERPILRTAPVPLFLLSEIVRRNGFKVVLSGEGADEVFGGYNIFREAKVRNFWARQPNSKFRGLLIEKLYPYVFSNPRLRAMQQSFFATGIDHPENPFFSHQIRWQNTSKIRTFLSREIQEASQSQENFARLEQLLPARFSRWDYLAKAQYLEMTIFLSNYLLSSQGDRMAMAHSVEIRVPYLDYRIIDFMGRVPARWKINGLEEKYTLKKSFKNILPEQITSRQKHPYRAPILPSLLKANQSGYLQDVLSGEAVQTAGLFDGPKVNRLLKKLRTTSNASEIDSMALVGLLSTQLIYEQFVVHFPFKNIGPMTPAVIIDRRSGSLN